VTNLLPFLGFEERGSWKKTIFFVNIFYRGEKNSFDELYLKAMLDSNEANFNIFLKK